MIKISLLVSDVQYDSIIDTALSVVLEQLTKTSPDNVLLSMLRKLNGLPNSMVKAALKVIPQESRDELAVYLLTAYKSDIKQIANKLATEKDIHLSIDDILIENIPQN